MKQRNGFQQAKSRGRLLSTVLVVVACFAIVIGLSHFASAMFAAPAVQSMPHSVFATLPGVESIAPSSQMVYATTDVNCTQVWAITPWGAVVLYASLPIPVSKCGEGSIVVAPAPCGCSSWVLYDVQEGQLFEISNWPVTVTWIANVTTTHIQQDMGITYDQVGLFNHDLIVTGTSQSDIWLVNPKTGSVTLLTSLGTHQDEGPAVAPMGFGGIGGSAGYGGDIIVPLQLLNEVVAVDPHGGVTKILDYSMAESVAFPTTCSVGLLVANQTAGTIDLYSVSVLKGLLNDGFVNGEGNRGIAAFSGSGTITTVGVNTHHLEQIAFL